jgi:RNA polymerase sigma factor (sigma-70 family)
LEELRSLVIKAQGRDLEAYGQIVRRFQDMAYGFAYAILGDFHLAEDVAQEAFVEAFRRLGSLREPAAFPGWFRRIVLGRCHRMKRGKRVPTVPLGSEWPLRSDRAGPDEKAERREMADKVLEAVRALPENERTVTTLFYIDGYSQKDIAEFLEVPVTTVNNRLHASRKRLKERMVAMVAEELNATKPEAEFHKLVEKAIALQEAEEFEDAVSAHQSALRSAEAAYAAASGSYCRLSHAYHKAGKTLELAEGLLVGAPSEPNDDEAEVVRNRLGFAGAMFINANRPQRAREAASKLLEMAEPLEGSPKYRFWRATAIAIRYEAAHAEGQPEQAVRLLEQVYAELAAYEEELSSTCRGLKSAADTDDHDLQEWFTWAGHAYHNIAVRALDHGAKDREEALRLMLRAAELRDCPATDLILAEWVLSVEGDRGAALGHFKKAVVGYERRGDIGWLRQEFERAGEFEPARNDPEFLAVIES